MNSHSCLIKGHGHQVKFACYLVRAFGLGLAFLWSVAKASVLMVCPRAVQPGP